MKKLGKFLMVGAVAAVAVAGTVGLTACGDKTYNGTYEGEYKYESPYAPSTYYGVKVTVTVEDNVITAVTCGDDTATMFNFTAASDWDGHDAGVAQLSDYLKSFEGKTVKEVKGIKVTCDAETNSAAYTVKGQPNNIDGYSIMTGATQSSGRLILAIQDALK